MQIIPDEALKRQQSAAWIAPDGELMLLGRDEMHNDRADGFPGMPVDDPTARDFPSTYAVAKLRYVKVSSPFQCAWDGRPQGRRGDARMETMASLMSQAAVMIKRSRYNPWGFSRDGDLTQIKVYVMQVKSPDPYVSQEREDTTVGDFIGQWGSRAASDYLYSNLLSERAWKLLRLLESRGNFDPRHRRIICEELARRSIL